MMIRRMFDFPDVSLRRQMEDFDRLRRQLDVLNGRFMGSGDLQRTGVFPLINLSENKDAYFVRAELPGVKANELDIQATGNSMSISGERHIPEENGSAKYHRREREAGKFSRMISLSNEIDPEHVEAKMENGILTITLPKAEKAKPRQVTVK
ncbi:MAG: Hsp20/alpha crystallin family protein [Proteobacteria bacterium]|nr:Hsp20/alpha crystallin family protein [Pseudomonadota bacterium]